MASLKAQLKQKQNRLKQKKLAQEVDEDILPRTKHQPNLTSVFSKLDPMELQDKRKEAMQKLEMKRDDLEIGIESFQNIKLPTRPPWTVEMTKEEVEGQEEEYFKEYVTNVQSQIGASFFEQNLQVWRQLWRVVEMSDVVLVVCDVRNPLLHFPPSLYDYIINQHQKQLILVLNKIDLVDDETVHAWKEYLQATYPEIIITTFSCSPKTESRVNCKRFYRAVGVLDVLEACKNLKIRKNVEIEWDKLLEETKRDLEERERLAVIAVQKAANGRAGNRDIKSKHPRRRKQFENMSSDDDEENSEAEVDGVTNQVDQLNMEEDKHDSYVTIGLIGQPNVGKSSLINAFKGKKFVSVSKTPGHTKHFQTIFLCDTIRLCDCPGLVFPLLIPKEIQILSGIYNIAQVQEPLGPLRFIAERIPLIEQLKLEHPEENENDFEWSPWTIAEAFAFQKGFLNAKSGRPDVHRGANLILRMNFDGRILISFKPPGFFIKASTIDLFSPTPVSSHSSEEQIVIKNKNEKKRRKQKAKQAQLHQLIGNVSD